MKIGRTLTIIFLIYWLSSQIYYYTQEHTFDPFLQNTPKELRKTDILWLGGSQVAQIGLKKTSAEILAELTGREVFNGGVPWYTTKHSLINYVCNYSGKANTVIITHAINDLCRSFSPYDWAIGEYNDRYSHFYGASMNGARPPTFEQFLIRKLARKVNIERFYVLQPMDIMVIWNTTLSYERYLTELVKRIKQDGSEVIIVAQPSAYGGLQEKDLYFGKTIAYYGRFVKTYPSGKRFENIMAWYNDTAKSVALEEKIKFITPNIPKTLEYFKDDVHLTEKGAKLLAEQIYAKIP